MKRKLLSIVLALCLTLTLLPTATFAAGSYADTNGHWAEAAIERWSGYGILQGADGRFSPDGTLTRAQMATILSRLLALPEASSYGFTDVAAGDWFADAIDRCAAAGIMQGTGGKAEPNAPITREQAMVMLCRALGIDAVAANLSGYPDGAQVSAYAAGYVAALVQMGIVKGDANGKLNPAGNITRAEIVTIIDRLITVYANVDGAVINAANGGTVLVTAKNVSVANAPEGTKVIAAKGADGLGVNGKPVAAGQTYIVPSSEDGTSYTPGTGTYVPHKHTWGAWVTTKEPTCAETGTKMHTCTVCGQTETAAIDKLAHSAGDAATCTTAQICTVCGQVIVPAAGHTWVVSGTETMCETTVTTYTCSVCRTTKTETAAGGSHTEVAAEAVAATCTAVGTTAGTKCSVCHAVLSGCETVPALGHDFAETWTSGGENHWHACTRCNARSAEAAHVYDDRTTTDWTSDELKTGKTCTVCGYFKDLSELGIYYVANAADLKAFAEKVNGGTSFAGKTVKLTADIDLANEPWTPLVTGDVGMAFTFDGNGKTISNLNATGEKNVGFFGTSTGCTIENLTIDGATVTGINHVAAIAGDALCTTIRDCTVKNAVITTQVKDNDDGDKAGAIAGYLSAEPNASVTGCTVENCTVKGYRDVGGLVGYANAGATITGNTVKDSTIINDRSSNYKDYTSDAQYDINAIVGEYNNGTLDSSNTATNVTVKVDLGDGFCKILGAESWYEISSANGLKAFAGKVNSGTSYKNETVKLTADIDLANEEWTPIGKSGSTFQGVFDGQGHTISNLYINNKWLCDAGLFGLTTDGEVKNLTLQNANVTGYFDVGAIAGTPYTSKYTNITLCGNVTVNGYAYVGGAFGKNAYANLTNITINADEGSYVKADSEGYRTYVGGVVGFMGEGNITVKNATSNIDVIGSTCDVGGISGIAHYGNTFVNCSSSGNVTLENATDDGDHLEIGGIAGVWLNTEGQTVTFTNCSFTGTLSTTLNGVDKTAELSPLHRIVGRKYSSEDVGKLIIDGVTQVSAAAQKDLTTIISNATAGEAISIELADGTYTLYNVDNAKTTNTTLTLTGNGAGKTIFTAGDLTVTDANGEGSSDYSYEGSEVTFKDMTINVGTGNYKGFVRAKSLYFENCTIEGRGSYWGVGKVVFKNCTFASNPKDYNLWTYSGIDFVFENCIFNTDCGKFINAYKEQCINAKLTFTDCKFINTGSANKPAVCLKSYTGIAWDVSFTNCTTQNASTDSQTQSNLYSIESGMSRDTKVTIDGTVVWQNDVKQ